MINEFLIQYGYWGMGVAAFLAGTVVPFNSEVILATLLVTTKMDFWLTIIAGTIGNVAGTMFNYYVGRVGSLDQICRWLHVKEARLMSTKNYVEKHGAWLALFTFLPFFGSVIAIALGILRSNAFGVMAYSTIGKFARYVLVAYTAVGVLNLF